MSQVPISVVVITKNEEKNLDECLQSVHGWASEIIIVDDESTDATAAVAEKYTDKIFSRRMDVEGRHRNWAYAQATQPWVLSLDADESLMDELKEEITATIKDTEFDVFSIPRRNYIGNYWVKHGGQYPSAQLRLWRKGAFRYEEAEVHPVSFVEGKIGHLTKDMIHKSYRNFEHFLAKLNGQTTLEATKWYQAKRKFGKGKAFWRAWDRFIRAFFVKKGYKDKFYGFMVAFFASLYQIISYAKYWEFVRREETKDQPLPDDLQDKTPRDDIRKAPITVVVICKNEEENIGYCLKSVHGWADEIIVVDDESTDKTVEIANEYADKVFRKKMTVEGKHRNWAYAQARNDWIISIDADEHLTDELKEEISEVLPDTDNHLFSMPLRTYIGTYWVKHSGWYPAQKARMFMKSRLRYEEVGVHPRLLGVEGGEKEGRLQHDIVHKGYPNFAHFLGSLNRQTTLEAQKWIETNRPMGRGKIFWRTIDRFPRVFLAKQGYKDGFIGFMIAYFASLYQIISYAKFWEYARSKGIKA